MTFDQLKSEIEKLSSADVARLLQWLARVYDSELWERRIGSEITRLGEAKFARLMWLEGPNGCSNQTEGRGNRCSRTQHG